MVRVVKNVLPKPVVHIPKLIFYFQLILLTVLPNGLDESAFASVSTELQHTIRETQIEFGNYPYRNFTQKTLGLFENPRTFEVTQGENGFIYASSSKGLLRFDGVNWITIPSPDESWIISLHQCRGKGILLNTSGGFFLFNERTQAFANIAWESEQINYFRYFKFYETEYGQIYFEDKGFLWMLDFNEMAFNRMELEGPFTEVDENSFFSLDNPANVQFDNLRVPPSNVDSLPLFQHFICRSLNSPHLFYGIYSNGCLYQIKINPETAELQPSKICKLPDFLPFKDIRSIKSISKNKLIVVTKHLGIHIIDLTRNGTVLHTIDQSRYPFPIGEINGTYLDNQGGLWIAKENGIARIDINSPITFLDSGLLGDQIIVDVLNFGDTLLFGTAKGILKQTRDLATGEIELKETSNNGSYHWNIEEIGGEIWTIVRDSGIYQLNPETLKISEDPILACNPKELEYSKAFNRILLTTFNQSVLIGELDKESSRISKFATTKAVDHYIYKSDLDQNEVLWLTASPGLLYYLPTKQISDFDKDNLKLIPCSSLPKSNHLTLEVGENETVVGVGEHLYRIDPQSFEPEPLGLDLGKDELGKQLEYTLISHISGSTYAASVSTNESQFHRIVDTQKEIVLDSYRAFNLLEGFTYTVSEKDLFGNLWLFGPNGAVKVDTSVERYEPQEANLYFNQISIDDVTFQPQPLTQCLDLGHFPSGTNHASFEVSFPSFLNKHDAEKSRSFTYTINGKSGSSLTNHSGLLEIPTLSSGFYEIAVSARDALNRRSDVITVYFRILPPWYASRLAIMLYILVGMLLMLLFVRWQLEVQKEKLTAERLENERKLQLEAAAKDAQIEALRLQINPHFLFNSLNFISNSLTTNPPVKESIERLSNFLKHALDERNAKLIRLQDELEAIKQYLEIQKGKSKRLLEIGYEIDPTTLNLLVPGLIVQPIVENALKYGEPDQSGILKIQLQSYVEEDLLKIVVRNSGQWKETITGRIPIGMKNVEKRLVLQYGDEAKLQVENRSDIHTVEISLIMPILQEA